MGQVVVCAVTITIRHKQPHHEVLSGLGHYAEHSGNQDA